MPREPSLPPGLTVAESEALVALSDVRTGSETTGAESVVKSTNGAQAQASSPLASRAQTRYSYSVPGARPSTPAHWSSHQPEAGTSPDHEVMVAETGTPASVSTSKEAHSHCPGQAVAVPYSSSCSGATGTAGSVEAEGECAGVVKSLGAEQSVDSSMGLCGSGPGTQKDTQATYLYSVAGESDPVEPLKDAGRWVSSGTLWPGT